MMAIAGWDSTSVAEEFHVQLGKRLDAAVKRGEIKACINNRSVRWGHILIEESVWEPLTGQDIRDLRLIAGDVLMCEGGEIGRAAVWSDQLPEAYFLNTLHRLRSKGGYNPYLLASFFERIAASGELAAVVGKATLAHLTKENLLKVRLPLPPADEQTRIVSALRSADDLIAALELLITKKQAIKQGMMQQLLTGRTRLPGFGEKWRRTSIGDIANQHRRTVDPRKEPDRLFQHFSLPAFDDGAIPQVVPGAKIESIKFFVPSEAILVSKLNPRIPRIWAPTEIGDNAVASTEFVVMTAGPGVSPSFLKWLMKSDAVISPMKRLATGTTGSHARIHPRQIAALKVVLPDEVEQLTIAAVLDDASHELQLLRARLTKARTIKTGMMQQLLTGRTRLPVEVES